MWFDCWLFILIVLVILILLKLKCCGCALVLLLIVSLRLLVSGVMTCLLCLMRVLVDVVVMWFGVYCGFLGGFSM